MRNPTAVLLVFTAVSASASCGRTAPSGDRTGASDSPNAPAAWSVAVQPIPSLSGPNSSEPQLTASNRGVILSWVERAGPMAQLKFAERTSSGWSQPTAVASGDNWFLSYADPPTVFRRPDGALIANWLVSTNPKFEGSDLYLSYSTDDGKTWARPFMPHHDGTEQQHAFPSFFELPEKGLGVIWLDGRDVQPSDANPEGGAMALRYAFFDAQWKRTAEGAVDVQACECCSTAAALTSDGVLIAFRDRSDKEIRDITVSRLESGKWTNATTVHADNWEVYACPVNGPALSARGRQAAVAWYTVKNDQGQAYAAFSGDAGRSWGAPVRLDDAASLGRVDIELLDDGSALATWVEYANRRAEFKLRRVEPSGGKSEAITVAAVPGGISSGFPKLARYGEELVFAWTESAQGAGESDNVTTVRTAVARLPQQQ